MLTERQKNNKRRLFRYVIIFCCLLIPLLGYLQKGLLTGDFNLPLSSTVLIFALININGLLLLLMLYLFLRNLVELLFDRNQKILGAQLRTRLVASFVCLSLIPTSILFFVALRFLSTSMDYWFNSKIEESLEASLKLAQSIFQETEQRAVSFSKQITTLIEVGAVDARNTEAISNLFSRTLAITPPGAPDALTLLDHNQQELLSRKGPRLLSIVLPYIPSEALRQAREAGTAKTLNQNTALGELIQVISSVQYADQNDSSAFLVTSLLIPSEQLSRMQAVSEGITGYRQLIMLKAPIKVSLIIMLLIITLLILFGAIWFGFYIARSLTDPINKLAQATRRVAEGDLDFILEKESDDEMGLLVESFNSMTSDLLKSNRQLEEAHKALQQTSLASEQQRNYLETILENVAAGVIALDENNRVTTVNRFAEELLGIKQSQFLGHDFHDMLARQHVMVVESFLAELQDSGKPSVERHLRVTVRKGDTLSLQVNLTRMVDTNNNPIGYVIVFDDLTKLERVQRLAAWQEVARRIAHEIKNPLTPIQLSAQRLRRRYLDSFTTDREIFDQCTTTIVRQVDEIKRLVSEFSNFARMPRMTKTPGDLASLVREVAVLYTEAHRTIRFTVHSADDLPSFNFDPIQIKRVLINLLDNAVAVQPTGGDVTISCRYDQQRVQLQVKDSGPGISAEVRMRLFEPYFSTRKSGTGLGLTIAHSIIVEHGGKITVENNEHKGAVFTVELPITN
ncbi:MAG: PAS domain-containing sensor histidine kinase [Desulfobulbus propionicus]|nr:MAG: PAS domain-containing sensor histidine kinase [Desulfobulbus propionicus]